MQISKLTKGAPSTSTKSRCFKMGDHLSEGTEAPQNANEEGNSKPSPLGGIQIYNNIWMKLKVNPNDEANDVLNSNSVSTPRSSAGASRTEDPRSQHPLFRNIKRKRLDMESTTCEECGKCFPSLKSKYGHLRCHPDRVHKRMMRRSSIQLVKRPATTTNCQTPALPDEVRIAAEILMQISRDDSHLRKEPVINIRMNKNQATDIMIEMGRKDAENSVVNHKSGSTRMYRCSICKISFATHQALGGHTASHNRRKNNGDKGKMMVVSNGEFPAKAECWVNSDCKASKMAGADHRCNICGLMFFSGQALGGHKRLHWTALNSRPISTLSSPQISGGKVAQSRTLGELRKMASTQHF